MAPRYAGHPLLGNLLQRSRDPLGMCLDSQRQLGDVVRFRMAWIHVEQLTHPDHVQHVLVDARTRYGKGVIWDKTRPLVGDGLLTSEGEEWRRRRRVAQPSFSRSSLAGLVDVLAAAVSGVLADWEPPATAGNEIAVFSEMKRLTLSMVLRALFGVDLADEPDEVAAAVTTTIEVTNRRIQAPTPYLPWLYRLPTRTNRRFDHEMRILDRVVDGLVTQRLRSDRDQGTPDLLDVMLAAADAEGTAFARQQLRDDMMTLVLAGHETTATALAWVFHLLARHPDVEDRLAAEIETVLSGRTPSAADLGALTYTEAVLNESMRLYPPVWALPRVALEDDEVSGHRIPRGDTVLLVPYVTHRHPDFWSDPERFDPDRFLPENAGSISRWAFVPFGAGQRQCIGNHFAVMEAKIVLAMVMQRFRLRSRPGVEVVPNPYLTLRPRGTMPMRVERAGF